MTKQYIKVAPITAEQWTGPQEMADKYNLHMSPRGYSILPTLEGDMRLDYGDYIATGIKGEHWAIDEKVFEATYKEVTSGCRFCEHSDDLSGMSDEKIEMKDMAFCYIAIPQKHGSYVLHYGSPGDGYDGQDYMASINYCPMCGRRLTNETIQQAF